MRATIGLLKPPPPDARRASSESDSPGSFSVPPQLATISHDCERAMAPETMALAKRFAFPRVRSASDKTTVQCTDVTVASPTG
jgi:hypothetical protein